MIYKVVLLRPAHRGWRVHLKLLEDEASLSPSASSSLTGGGGGTWETEHAPLRELNYHFYLCCLRHKVISFVWVACFMFEFLKFGSTQLNDPHQRRFRSGCTCTMLIEKKVMRISGTIAHVMCDATFFQVSSSYVFRPHCLAGESIACPVWRDGVVVGLPAADLPVEGLTEERGSPCEYGHYIENMCQQYHSCRSCGGDSAST